MLELAIKACKKQGKYVGICGQGPSDHPDLAEWLLEQGIESMSLNPDTVVDTWLRLAKRDSAEVDVASTAADAVAARSVAKARTGNVDRPATFTGTALNVAPVGGEPGRGR